MRWYPAHDEQAALAFQIASLLHDIGHYGYAHSLEEKGLLLPCWISEQDRSKSSLDFLRNLWSLFACFSPPGFFTQLGMASSTSPIFYAEIWEIPSHFLQDRSL